VVEARVDERDRKDRTADDLPELDVGVGMRARAVTGDERVGERLLRCLD